MRRILGNQLIGHRRLAGDLQLPQKPQLGSQGQSGAATTVPLGEEGSCTRQAYKHHLRPEGTRGLRDMEEGVCNSAQALAQETGF